jgi:hypothetical protein
VPEAPQRIEVHTPSALLGFMLVLRLQGLAADVEPDEAGGWLVVLPAETRRDRVLSAVQSWLDDEALDETTVRFGGELVTLRGRVAAGAAWL